MNSDDKGWIASWFGQLSTGLKMLLILSAGLLPLGLIAVLASIDNAQDNRAKDEIEARAGLIIVAQRLNSAVSRSAITIRAASDAVADRPPDSDICRRAIARLAALQPVAARYALYGDDNRLRCATPGFSPEAAIPVPNGGSSFIEVTPDGGILRFALFDTNGSLDGIGEFDRDSLAQLVAPPEMEGAFTFDLRQGERLMRLRDGYRRAPLEREVRLAQPLANGRLSLSIRTAAVPLSPSELAMILLPVMMWAAAAVIGWWIVDRLLLRPLVRMQQVISRYQPGDQSLDLPTLRSPAREIGELGQAFDRVTQTVARHEADLEAAVDRQTRLVREVHHRVKNNLQVVASLLNLHSRGAANEEVAAAYASIQRRVDALAVVHRNHYAELEENLGVALKPLISELGANLRATAPQSAAHTQIRLDVSPAHVTQDVAVSVAFLITEIVEFAMLCGMQTVSISLTRSGANRARLAIETEGGLDLAACDANLVERVERIVTGLSRQLRSTLDREPQFGWFAVEIAVLD